MAAQDRFTHGHHQGLRNVSTALRIAPAMFALRAQCGRDVRAPSIHFKYGFKSNLRFASKGFHRSPSFAIRFRTLSRRKSSILTPRSSSFQVTGVETVAFGVGRTE